MEKQNFEHPNPIRVQPERDEDPFEQEDPVFNERFKERENFDGIETIDIAPARETGKNPVLFAPGFSRTPATFKNSLRVFYGMEREAISLSHPRLFGEVKNDEHKPDMPKEVLRRATSLYKLALKNIDKDKERCIDRKYNLVGQSAGGLDAPLAAMMIEEERPGSIGNLVLVDPAGIIGPDNAKELKTRFKEQITDNKEVMNSGTRPFSAVNNQKTAAKEFVKYLLKNPKRAMKEIEGMTAVRLEELLVSLKEASNIGISIIHGVDDKTFPMDRVQEGAKERGLPDAIDGFYSVKGGHNELYLNPQKYIPLVVEAMAEMERKAKSKIEDR